MQIYEKAHPRPKKEGLGSLCCDKACAEEPDPSVFSRFKHVLI